MLIYDEKFLNEWLHTQIVEDKRKTVKQLCIYCNDDDVMHIFLMNRYSTSLPNFIKSKNKIICDVTTDLRQKITNNNFCWLKKIYKHLNIEKKIEDLQLDFE